MAEAHGDDERLITPSFFKFLKLFLNRLAFRKRKFTMFRVIGLRRESAGLSYQIEYVEKNWYSLDTLTEFV